MEKDFLSKLISIIFYKKRNNTVFMFKFLTKTNKRVLWIGTYKPDFRGRGANYFLKRGLAVFGFSGSVASLIEAKNQTERIGLFSIPTNIPFKLEKYNNKFYIKIPNEFR